MTLVKGPFATNIGVQNSKMLLYQQSCIYLLLQESTSIPKQKGSLSHYSKSNHNNYFMIGLLSLGHIFLNQVVSITQERGGGFNYYENHLRPTLVPKKLNISNFLRIYIQFYFDIIRKIILVWYPIVVLVLSQYYSNPKSITYKISNLLSR